ncbi:hypothetical protein AB6A40_011708 [Gnathostoma spinigerum]|uniref:CUB domain-containing protein n=1 Tax=Gnathostoma spinigerum TaxID=75299 RepID=A0ABD6F2A7_9BILA
MTTSRPVQTYTSLSLAACNCFENNLDVAVGEQKTLSSPGFPMEYCDNLDCSVRIKLITLNYQDTNLKQTLLISITNFSLEFPHDMLHIFSRKGQSSHYLMR